MKHLLLLCLLATVSGCVAEFPDRPYRGGDHYNRNYYERDDRDRRGWDNRRDHDEHYRNDDSRRDRDNH